jgi:hypothetical protein
VNLRIPKRRRQDDGAGNGLFEISGRKIAAIIGILFTTLMGGGGIFAILILKACERNAPHFYLSNSGYINPRDTLFIYPQNEEAQRNSGDFPIKIDELAINDGAKYLPRQGKKAWFICLASLPMAPELKRNRSHSLVLLPSACPFADTLKFIVDESAPSVGLTIESDSGDAGKKIVKGKLLDEMQAGDTLNIEIFLQTGSTKTFFKPSIYKVRDQGSGASYYEFETPIYDIPKFQAKDSGFTKPFFGFRVRDQAGNTYYNNLSYAQFIAPGNNSFGFQDVAHIHFNRVSSDSRSSIKFMVQPMRDEVSSLPDGREPITLRVTAISAKANSLEWKTNLPDSVLGEEASSLVMKDGKNIAVIAHGAKFVDKNVEKEKRAEYRVEMVGRTGTKFTSNRYMSPKWNPPKPLARPPKSLKAPKLPKQPPAMAQEKPEPGSPKARSCSLPADAFAAEMIVIPCDTLIIAESESVTLHAGVTVCFSKPSMNSVIKVEGTLTASGNKNAYITFHGSCPDSTKRESMWGGIEVGEAGVLDLQYCGFIRAPTPICSFSFQVTILNNFFKGSSGIILPDGNLYAMESSWHAINSMDFGKLPKSH